VAPRGDETVIVKQFPNCFVQTDLDDRLKALSARDLVLAGFMTHMCVNSTARGAFNLGSAAGENLGPAQRPLNDDRHPRGDFTPSLRGRRLR
jgi:Isochorismatase family